MEQTEGCACLSEEQRSAIWQTNWTGHADGFARLSEEKHAERCAHHDMGVIYEEQDSCDTITVGISALIQDTS